MAEIIELPTHADPRGSLTVLEKKLPFEIKRAYWMTDLKGEARGRHRHLLTRQALVCLQGACEVFIQIKGETQTYLMDKPNEILLLEPQDWHELRNFRDNPVILVFASHHYDPNDYVKEPL